MGYIGYIGLFLLLKQEPFANRTVTAITQSKITESLGVKSAPARLINQSDSLTAAA